jgi:hypothetical protein
MQGKKWLYVRLNSDLLDSLKKQTVTLNVAVSK